MDIEFIKRIKIVDADTGEELMTEPENCESCPFVYRKREDHDGKEFEDSNDIIGCWIDPCMYGGDPTPLFVMSKEYNKNADWSHDRPSLGDDFACPFRKIRQKIEEKVLNIPEWDMHKCSLTGLTTVLSRDHPVCKCGHEFKFGRGEASS